MNIYNTSFPSRRVKAAKFKSNKPWISGGLLTSIRKKNKLYKKFLSIPTSSYENLYKKYKINLIVYCVQPNAYIMNNNNNNNSYLYSA